MMSTLEEALKLNHTIDIRDHLDELSPEWAQFIQEKITQHEQAVEARHAFEALQASLTKNRIGFYVLGLGIGAVSGYFLAKRRLQTKYSKIADQEIEEMREHYREKTTAFEAEFAKRPLSEIVEERGYNLVDPPGTTPSEPEDIPPPMGIQPDPPPPSLVMVEKETPEEEPPGREEVRNVFKERTSDYKWNWHEERRKRSPDIPYVIHVDEKHDMDYDVMTLTYYEGDDVLCNERDEVIDRDYERDELIGDKNLERFGHGSNDSSIVYIRNDKLELVYEVIKNPHHYAEEVHGFEHSDEYRNLQRMRAKERDEQEE